MDQFEPFADLALLLVRIAVQPFDMLAGTLDAAGLIGVPLLHFLDQAFFFHPSLDAVRSGKRDGGVDRHHRKRHPECPTPEPFSHRRERLEDNGNIACNQMTDKIVVLNTCGSEDEAVRLARLLVDRRLAACVSIVPRLRSIYRWNGAVESAEEWLLLIKSSRALFEDLRTVLEGAHSYDVPEVLALPVVDGAAPYLNWMQANLQEGAATE